MDYSPLPLNLSNQLSSKYKFSPLFQSGKFSDFTLIYSCKGELIKKFKVHKNILYSTSEYFHVMFDGDWKEKAFADFSLGDVIPSCESYQIFLNYLYTDKYPKRLESFGVYHLYRLGDYYLVPKLKEKALKELKSIISFDNAFNYIRFTKETHGNEEISNIIVDFVAKNFRELSLLKFPFHELGELINKVFELICAPSAL